MLVRTLLEAYHALPKRSQNLIRAFISSNSFRMTSPRASRHISSQPIDRPHRCYSGHGVRFSIAERSL
jgi:hypothetical protein